MNNSESFFYSGTYQKNNSKSQVIFSKVCDIDINVIKPLRAGIIFYTTYLGKLYFGMGNR